MACAVFGLSMHCGGAERRVAALRPTPGPALSLPEISSQEVAIPGFPPDAEVPNDLRAWHFAPKMVPALLELQGAVADESRLSKGMMRKMVVIVASRNGCRY